MTPCSKNFNGYFNSTEKKICEPFTLVSLIWKSSHAKSGKLHKSQDIKNATEPETSLLP